MYDIRIRWVLVGLLVAVGFLFYVKNLAFFWIYFLFASLLSFITLRHGTISGALKALQEGNELESQRLLSQVKFKDLLSPPKKAYFYFIDGMLKIGAKRELEGLDALNKCLQLEKVQPHTKALILYCASVQYFNFSKLKEARDYIKRAREVEHKDLKLKELIKDFEKKIPIQS